MIFITIASNLANGQIQTTTTMAHDQPHAHVNIGCLSCIVENEHLRNELETVKTEIAQLKSQLRRQSISRRGPLLKRTRGYSRGRVNATYNNSRIAYRQEAQQENVLIEHELHNENSDEQ
ncbi:hypothetical protein WR25_25213 [Diploscapter pachys]|uniref:Uncharacterized protein n=1 Tax=Diploscapter pachys TaxID=2018661 RepID=A0A2A2LF53_9BILA|nr:hypothetical protein WR25_25213 [Diploscapter pachys]